MATHFRCTLRELAERITVDELPLWIAWASIEPFGREADDISRALVGAALINAWGGECRVDDLIPKYEATQGMPEEISKELAAASWAGFVEQHNRGIKCPASAVQR